MIKASVGTAFRAPIVFCDDALSCMKTLQAADIRIAVMDSHAERSLFDEQDRANTVFVLGGETGRRIKRNQKRSEPYRCVSLWKTGLNP